MYCISVRKYAVSEYWEKRDGNFFINDSKRHCFYPCFMDLQPCFRAVRDSDFPGDGRYYIGSDYPAFCGIVFSFHA